MRCRDKPTQGPPLSSLGLAACSPHGLGLTTPFSDLSALILRCWQRAPPGRGKDPMGTHKPARVLGSLRGSWCVSPRGELENEHQNNEDLSL